MSCLRPGFLNKHLLVQWFVSRTIEMKPLQQYVHLVLFVLYIVLTF